MDTYGDNIIEEIFNTAKYIKLPYIIHIILQDKQVDNAFEVVLHSFKV